MVLTSTDPSELCINGMSFSRRSSRWANAALVVSVSSKDFEALNYSHGVLAGVEFQVFAFSVFVTCFISFQQKFSSRVYLDVKLTSTVLIIIMIIYSMGQHFIRVVSR